MDKIKKDKSFGIIPLRNFQGKWQVFLIENARGNFTGFPKGHREFFETGKKAAKRELKEETGLEVERFLDKAIEESYSFKKEGITVQKKVKYFLALVCGNISLQKEEISNGYWVDLEKAEDKITFSECKEVCLEVLNFIRGEK